MLICISFFPHELHSYGFQLVDDGRVDRQTDKQTCITSYKDTGAHLETAEKRWKNKSEKKEDQKDKRRWSGNCHCWRYKARDSLLVNLPVHYGAEQKKKTVKIFPTSSGVSK